jgi:hypothetical protein
MRKIGFTERQMFVMSLPSHRLLCRTILPDGLRPRCQRYRRDGRALAGPPRQLSSGSSAGGPRSVDEMVHVWHVFAKLLPEAQQAIEKVGSYVIAHTS